MFRSDERGQSVVLIAVSLPIVLALLLLVIDGGRLYVERERIRNAAQLAAEAAVSLAADSPGRSQPSEQQVRDVVKQALDRNLPGEVFVHSVMVPFRADVPTFNVRVSVTKLFRASVQAVTFNVAADGAAKLGGSTEASSQGRAPTATSCYRTTLGPFYVPFAVTTVLIDGRVAPGGVFFGASSSTHQFELAGSRPTDNVTGTLQLPGQAVAASAPIYASSGGILARYTSTWGVHSECP